MKKFFLISILLLILITSLVKNSTKEIEDKIFTKKENTKLLSAEMGDMILEYNYLSSPEKLMKYQSQYFENSLTKKNIIKIKKIVIENENLKITNYIEEVKTDE
jgi:hypothetical protein|tara:strand:+ start:31 stop:342 length:312 start_codon:yes stop_codon:yes gene_type:complete